ncbi:MAG: hypothetical protein M1825_004215 [Sarcosagium campestre]|nr:MAG: hypothetical protein M1825_004215 [Sarcosagium campestre]
MQGLLCVTVSDRHVLSSTLTHHILETKMVHFFTSVVSLALAMLLSAPLSTFALDVRLNNPIPPGKEVSYQRARLLEEASFACDDLAPGTCCQAPKTTADPFFLHYSLYDMHYGDRVTVWNKAMNTRGNGCSGTLVRTHSDLDRSGGPALSQNGGSTTFEGSSVSGIMYINCTQRTTLKQLWAAIKGVFKKGGVERFRAVARAFCVDPTTGACYNTGYGSSYASNAKLSSAKPSSQGFQLPGFGLGKDTKLERRRNLDGHMGYMTPKSVLVNRITFNGTEWSDDRRGDGVYRDEFGNVLDLDLLEL